MPKWTKPDPAMSDLFDEAIPSDSRVQRRKMFGFPSIFVGGHMCAGLFQDGMFVRLSPADRTALPGARPFEPMPGRPMKDYVMVPDDWLADELRLADLLAQAVAFTASLPIKETKPRNVRARPNTQQTR